MRVKARTFKEKSPIKVGRTRTGILPAVIQEAGDLVTPLDKGKGVPAMRMLTGTLFVLAMLLDFSSTANAEVMAVEVPKSHYTGTWLEIARRPMFLTNGCVAGFTTYEAGRSSDEVAVLDGCHQGTPSGKLKTVKGKGRLLDADTKRAKLRVRYPFFITFNYWVLYVSPDRSWFISGDPGLRNLWIYARRAPTEQKLAIMVRKAKALGYDVSKLEFPETGHSDVYHKGSG